MVDLVLDGQISQVIEHVNIFCYLFSKSTYPFVHLIALDFSKAFDTVRHSTMMGKFSNFPIPDNVYNWVVNFLTNRCHHTKFSNLLSILAFINASIVQGSGLGPCSFVLDASDLHPQDLINLLFKYADDMDLVVPASHTHTIQLELEAIFEMGF